MKAAPCAASPTRLEGAGQPARQARPRRRGHSAALRLEALAVVVLFALLALVVPPVLSGEPGPAASAPATRAAALQQLDSPDAGRRLAAVERLAELGTMADVQRLVRALRDASAPVRDAASTALWAVWSRSGDAATDRQLAEGTRLMSEGEFGPALALFDRIVRERPAFAEGWNKRATVLFLMGRDDESLRDCDEVLKRNPHHFGALSGMAQIHLRRDDPEQALKAYERALEVNPNLRDGPLVLRMLEEAARERRRAGGGRST